MASGVIPTKLPNPQNLTFTGGATGTYNGSKALSVNVPKDAYYTTIANTADDKGTNWSGYLSAISNSFGVLYLRASGTPNTGTHKLRLNMRTGLSACAGTALPVSIGSGSHIGTATATIVTNEIDVEIYLTQGYPNTAVAFPLIRIV